MRKPAGFTLVEVLVATVMLAIVVVTIARGESALAILGHTNDVTAKRTAALLMEANKFGAIPFSKIATWSTADVKVTRGDFTYTRKLTIAAQNSALTRYTIKIIIVPSTATTKTDSITVDRSNPPSYTPLCMGC